MNLLDPHGRRINYLRLSVTDRCNLRCSYCRPPGMDPEPSSGARLSDDELLFLARAAVGIGIEKIRITGGEPLLRNGIARLLSRLRMLPGLKKLVLTTNGLLLAEMAGDLRRAGVESLNVSLDSLVPDRFVRITGSRLQPVLEGIEKALEQGFPSVKINVVVMRGVNDDEVVRFAALTIGRPLTVRFIEPMPLSGKDCGPGLTVPGEEILRRVRERYPLTPRERESLGGPARYYRMEGASGTIGVITPVSCHFCGDCNRIRVTCEGFAKGCLFSARDVDLKPYLAGRDAEGLMDTLRSVVGGKPTGHRFLREGRRGVSVDMSRVGG
ncbi:MAG: GTP 3',8-cyclase MoaA [Deltaproteobacteria bacterium]|nr:MAG: GTP 3',8-cyclase MoaA [Deltaproteobacteria bacterium]